MDDTLFGDEEDDALAPLPLAEEPGVSALLPTPSSDEDEEVVHHVHLESRQQERQPTPSSRATVRFDDAMGAAEKRAKTGAKVTKDGRKKRKTQSPQIKSPEKKSTFDEVLARVKERSRHRRDFVGPDEAKEHVQQLVDRMAAAAQKDEDAIAMNVPATAKLLLVDEAATEIAKPNWTNWYLQGGICCILDRWLATDTRAELKGETEPEQASPADAAAKLPNEALRRKVLLLLAKLASLSADHLQDNTLGNKLVVYWHHPLENEANRVLIRQIVGRVVRPILSMYGASRTTPAALGPETQGDEDEPQRDDGEPLTTQAARKTQPSPSAQTARRLQVSKKTSPAANTAPGASLLGRSSFRANIPNAAPRTYAVAPRSNVNQSAATSSNRSASRGSRSRR